MKERLFKKKCIKQNNRRTYVVNMLFSVTVVTLTMHVAFQKNHQCDFTSCDISLQACGGWAGSSQNCGCRIFNFMVARFRAASITEKGCEAFQTATQIHHRFWTAKVLCWGSVCFGIGFTVCYAWLLYGTLI